MSTASDEENDSESPLWRREVTLGDLNALREGNMTAHLGIEFVELGPDFIRATMPVDERTVQPFGLLHGGASVALAETLGSVAAHACLPEGRTGVGLEINANHVRAMRAGHVTGTVRPVHVGRTTQVWQIRITDEGEKRKAPSSARAA
jgi:1,4-dihydroxy-2-naphthoyl-CoA hydrolase